MRFALPALVLFLTLLSPVAAADGSPFTCRLAAEPGVGGTVGDLYRSTRDYASGTCQTVMDSAWDIAQCVRDELLGGGC